MAHGIDDGVQLCALLGCARGSHHEAAQTAGAGLAVDDLYAPGMPFFGKGARRLGRALARPRDAGGYVNGDHVASCTDERLVAGAKVPHRGLRGRRQRRGFAQPRIEGIEVVVLMLGPQVTIPAHIQADLANPPPVDQPPRQVRRAVGHHGDTGPHVGCSDVSRGAHARAKPRGITPPLFLLDQVAQRSFDVAQSTSLTAPRRLSGLDAPASRSARRVREASAPRRGSAAS